jgi:hypothetical protein
MQYFLVASLLLTITVSPSFAWGPEGHRVIADIARSHLTPAARQDVRELQGNDDLAAGANWADEVKSDRPETGGWHFVDIPMNAGGFSEARDCYHPSDKHANTRLDRHNCVVDRIKMFTQTLADLKASSSDRIEALKFLVHFVGDIHQPLHAIGEARGGNDIHVIEFGSAQCGSRPCNLHFVWDIGLMEHSARRESEYAQFLERVIEREGLSSRADRGSEAWANESFQLAKKFWVSNGGVVDETYYRRSIPIVDKQLALAGVRLRS